MQLLVAILAVVIGLAFAFGGWRFFLLLLPLWGFVVGFLTATIVLGITLGFAAGVLSGFFGVGGGILFVPTLTLVADARRSTLGCRP